MKIKIFDIPSNSATQIEDIVNSWLERYECHNVQISNVIEAPAPKVSTRVILIYEEALAEA
ncbi:MAG TPA: hypothetical protein VFQ86_07680 [Arachidicoccus soli]|nr:hypothetical protein [Arachidicoccus soli]